MKYLNGKYYVEVKDKRYITHPNEKIILRFRDELKRLRTQYQVQNNTQIRKNQKDIKTNNEKKEVRDYPQNKKQPIIEQPINKRPDCPSCKSNIYVAFDKRWY